MEKCDVCQLESPFMCSLADQRTRDLINECIGVKVPPGDSSPQRICPDCWIQYKSWTKFRFMSRIFPCSQNEATTTGQLTKVVQQIDNVIAGSSRQVPTTANRRQPPAPATDQGQIVVQTQSNRIVRGRGRVGQVGRRGTTRRPKNCKCNYCHKEYVNIATLLTHERTHNPMAGGGRTNKVD